MAITHDVLDGLFGVSVGDALGVPVEFYSRKELKTNPVTDMRGHGSHNQPPGTWSDDSSLTFCLTESLCHGFDLQDMADKFCKWMWNDYWTPHGRVFDVGTTTSEALFLLRRGVSPLQSGGTDENSNGNGSLMRILPLSYYLEDITRVSKQNAAQEGKKSVLDYAHQVSCLTHAHPRSQMACGMYVLFAISLLQGIKPEEAYETMCDIAIQNYHDKEPYAKELPYFAKILKTDISKLPEEKINSDGYVVYTLEAALWCFLNSHSYAETVLKAVNLGEDTDTTAAVAGGLAGIYYGWKSIPPHWIEQLAKREEIVKLARRFEKALNKNKT